MANDIEEISTEIRSAFEMVLCELRVLVSALNSYSVV